VSVSPLAELIRAEIAGAGPIPFRRYMELALYHPEHGYYTRGRDPFGKAGDFYTAEQLQPVFGILIAARVRALFEEMGSPCGFTVVELGSGRAEMAEAFSQWRYMPVEAGRGQLPERFTGVVFANEFFDALPVEAAVLRGGEYRQMRVGWSGGRFTWVEDGPAAAEVEACLRRYTAFEEDGSMAEANLDALAWLERVAERLDDGFLFAIDYGYTRRESVRFPQGTLMSYRRHLAHEDVLAEPGERDLTAHVNFTALEEHAESLGFETVCFESLPRTLMAAGEADEFAAALGDGDERRRRQLKMLLFGMGETFRTLILRKG
jgi:SAM-dependent MidA family methyltransferase